ncbi:MAG: GNAT family N-acetyltransferase [Bacteroidales bacterium]|jgi:RimJ/RimL family protein N-acetyltransferase
MFKIEIRPLKIEDAKISYKWRNDPEIWKYTGNRPNKIITLKIEKDWIKNAIQDKSTRRFAIIVNDIYIGNVQLTNIIENETGQIHIFIGNKIYWGKGIATKAIILIVKYATEILKLHELYAFINANNIPSIKAFEKNGFVRLTDEVKMVKKLI